LKRADHDRIGEADRFCYRSLTLLDALEPLTVAFNCGKESEARTQ
jgi:hypothetical protein